MTHLDCLEEAKNAKPQVGDEVVYLGLANR